MAEKASKETKSELRCMAVQSVPRLGVKGKGLQSQDWGPVGLVCNDTVSLHNGVTQVQGRSRRGIFKGPTPPATARAAAATITYALCSG